MTILLNSSLLVLNVTKQTQRARNIYKLFEKIGIDKIRYITTYSANSIAELSDSQIQTIIDYFSKNPNTELPDDQDVSDIDSEEEISDDQTNASEAVSAEVSNPLEAEDDYYKMLLEDCAKDCVYCDKEVDSTPQSVKETNEEVASQSGGESNEIKSDNDSNSSDSEEEMPDDSDDDGYDEYGGYNVYGERDRGCYYRDGRYERKVSPMMSPIISGNHLGELSSEITYSHRLNYRIGYFFFFESRGWLIQKRLRYSKPDHLKCAEDIGKILAEE